MALVLKSLCSEVLATNQAYRSERPCAILVGMDKTSDLSMAAQTDKADSGAQDKVLDSTDDAKPLVFNNAPIGIFDSGLGGLTVAREIIKRLPEENLIYLGDSARCPYGSRDLEEVKGFVDQICHKLVDCGVKLIVIACNTATAAGLIHAQKHFPVPVIGVVEPGARAACQATFSRRVGVVATKATVESNVYADAIRHLDAGITVFSVAAPRFVEIVENNIRMAVGPVETYMADVSKVFVRPEFEEIAREYLEPLRRCSIDTLVLGCTHYPLLKALIGSVIGREVTLISSAKETAKDVCEILERRSAFAKPGNQAQYTFYTTGDTEDFRQFGSRILSVEIDEVNHIELPE